MASPMESSSPWDDRTVICIGDIHGFHSKLLRLWSNLESAVPPRSFRSAVVIFLGDYCDRGPDTRLVLHFLLGLPLNYPHQRHVFLCGNHDLAFAAFVGALPAPATEGRWEETWREYERSEEREGWYRGEGFEEMHVQGRRWGGDVGDGYNGKKGTYYQGSIYDSRPTFQSYGVPHGSPELVKAVPEEHKKFLHDLVWVHEEEDVEIDTEEKGRIRCKLIAVHAGLEKTKNVEERLQVLRARDTSLPTVEELRGRKNVWDIPMELTEKPTIVVSGHHGKLHIDGLRFIIDESGGLEHLHMAAIIFPSKQIVRD